MKALITRQWHGTTLKKDADTYLNYLEQTGIPGYKKTPGLQSVEVWRKIEGDICHFWTVTKWDSWQSIEGFTGPDLNKAKYYPEDANYLLSQEATVQHYETFVY